jgi:hypothetical protein
VLEESPNTINIHGLSAAWAITVDVGKLRNLKIATIWNRITSQTIGEDRTAEISHFDNKQVSVRRRRELETRRKKNKSGISERCRGRRKRT